ncbi:putative oxidoreductase [Paraburkholderia graminis C4D1M]|uniref:Short-chain dehydrogenase/reductase SDR n=1 Tax=Paraburkholderia graminis (strain ATCC 700544 / DSM 17151 / LMG 18924 / NCIMB 13744 / C4D1M) TaxID=396598 RepID=B1G822_PARG4|nr:short-chain dehydrogenase/reductase SDR [Paraburkholderia graminis C4D1M]CAB3653314.1 putative oxidoreductase [Paraburkholderia graminis C4D1M]
MGVVSRAAYDDQSVGRREYALPAGHFEETALQIHGKGFVVTGGGSGLGAATARRLVAGGARVLLIDLDEDAGASLAAELGANAHFARADVSDSASAERALAAYCETFGALHGLINCAGVAPAEKVLGREGPHRLESFARTVQINLIGAFNMVRLAAACMAGNTPGTDGERGVIINTASVAAFDGQIGQAGYAASKGGVVAMTLPVARELARHGIRVLAVAPGIMETPMLKGMPTEVQDALGKMVPFPPRLGRPEEFAALVLHIVENTYLNGEVIRLDGAIRMAAK